MTQAAIATASASTPVYNEFNTPLSYDDASVLEYLRRMYFDESFYDDEAHVAAGPFVVSAFASIAYVDVVFDKFDVEVLNKTTRDTIRLSPWRNTAQLYASMKEDLVDPARWAARAIEIFNDTSVRATFHQEVIRAVESFGIDGARYRSEANELKREIELLQSILHNPLITDQNSIHQLNTRMASLVARQKSDQYIARWFSEVMSEPKALMAISKNLQSGFREFLLNVSRGIFPTTNSDGHPVMPREWIIT